MQFNETYQSGPCHYPYCLPYPKKFSRYDEENSDDNQGGQQNLL